MVLQTNVYRVIFYNCIQIIFIIFINLRYIIIIHLLVSIKMQIGKYYFLNLQMLRRLPAFERTVKRTYTIATFIRRHSNEALIRRGVKQT